MCVIRNMHWWWQRQQVCKSNYASYPPTRPTLTRLSDYGGSSKKECLYSIYYPSFEPFKAAIENCLNNTHTKHKPALDTLLTLRFQLFEKTQFLTGWSITEFDLFCRHRLYHLFSGCNQAGLRHKKGRFFYVLRFLGITVHNIFEQFPVSLYQEIFPKRR